MSAHVRDRIVGAILLVFATGWCIVVWNTIPEGYGEAAVGPRDVPFWLGILLGILALGLIGQTLFGENFAASDATNGKPGRAAASPDYKSEWWAIAVVTISLLAYALLMEWFGFVVATVVVIASLLRFGLDVRSLPLLLGMSLSMSFGVYFVMGGLMGVYLPRGTIISPF